MSKFYTNSAVLVGVGVGVGVVVGLGSLPPEGLVLVVETVVMSALIGAVVVVVVAIIESALAGCDIGTLAFAGLL